jgi:hypothetical protein
MHAIEDFDDMSNLQTGTQQHHIDGDHEGCPRCRQEYDRAGRCDCDYEIGVCDTLPPPGAGDMAQLPETAGEVES